MSSNPCQICGCTGLNLVDGFYYCVECGTQDTNVRETVVEKTIYEEQFGGHTATDTRKYNTVLKNAFQMSGEWCKWHAFNFILAGLADELLAAGAKPTVKLKILWIWLRYIKKFQIKDQPEATLFENRTSNEEDKNESHEDNTDNELNDSASEEEDECRKDNKRNRFLCDISKIRYTLLLGILYTALNLDKSDIQLSHLYRFIKEGRLSVFDCLKFVPKELPLHLVSSSRIKMELGISGACRTRTLRRISMTLLKQLDLGVPLVPDLNKIIKNYIKELCLPNDFRELVFSLTNLMPCNFLAIDAVMMKDLVSIPDYEGFCMSYVLLALKMCFGLDGDYENRLSDTVDKINSEEDYLKSYNLGMYTEPTDRLFSFREWCSFIQFRKIVLSQYYYPVSAQYNLPIDDCVFMEHTDERKVQKMRLSYDVAMNILNKIPTDEPNVIPKKHFQSTLTPLTTYTVIIKEHIKDPEVKLRLCEDFTQYSLKYITTDLKLPKCRMNIEGVDPNNKVINPNLTVGDYQIKKANLNMVLVRHCDNKNWLKTRPPKIKHVTKIDKNRNNNGYDSDSELSSEKEIEESLLTNEDAYHNEDACDVIEEENKVISIFDDDFKNLNIDEKGEKETRPEETDSFQFLFKTDIPDRQTNDATNMQDFKIDVDDTETVFDPETFNRKKIIEELIEIACKKYKIPVPKEKVCRMPVKRKNLENIEAEASSSKKIKSVNRMKPGEAMILTHGLVSTYYENIQNDLLLLVSENVKSAIQTAQIQAECYTTDDALNDNTPHNPDGDINNINLNTFNNYIDDTVNNLNDELGTEIQNNATDGDLQGNANISDDNISNFHEKTQDDILNSEIDDDDRQFNIEELLPKCEPKFDPKTHDIKQLYINLKEEFEDCDVYDLAQIDNDQDINNIIDKKIVEFSNFSKKFKPSPNKNAHKEESFKSDESEDDISSDELSIRQKGTSKLKHLIRNRDINMYMYWIRNYQSKKYKKFHDLNRKFNLELSENCPKSFVFVINECASISNCTAFSLLNKLNHWEASIKGLFLEKR